MYLVKKEEKKIIKHDNLEIFLYNFSFQFIAFNFNSLFLVLSKN
jgi:hypothetical protein